MDTKNQSDSKIPAIRTYAKDLESNRKAKGLPAETPVPVEKEKVASVKPAALKKEFPKTKATTPKTAAVSAPYTTSLPPLSTIHKKEHRPTKVVTVSSKDSSFVVEDGEGDSATIITDTKRDRFKLFPAIFTSISDWFADKKLSYKVKKAPKYTVPETTRRKGVIQKATGVTGKLATSDFSLIHERIRQRKENDEKPEATTTWSANTEPGFLLLENPVSETVSNVKIIARKSFRVTPEKFAVKEAAPVPPAPLPEPVEKVVEVPEIKMPEPAEIETTPTEVMPASYLEEESVVTNVVKESGEAKLSFPAYLRLLLRNTNTLALGISGLVLAIIIACVYGYFIFTQPRNYISEANAANTIQILDTPIMLAAGRTNEKSSLLEVLELVKKDSTKATQVAFIFKGLNKSLIPPHILMAIFNISLDKNLSRSISHLRLGYTNDKTPFMVMKSTDETAVKGGLLSWEPTMQKDLTELFSIETAEPVLPARFVDASLDGFDVRIMKNENGSDLLVYGVINDTVLITLDSFNFTELSNLIK